MSTKIQTTIESIRALPLPSREYEAALRRQKANYEAAHREHDRHGKVIQRYVLDWSYVAAKTRHSVSVRPYVSVRVCLPHGREVGPAVVDRPHGDGRCMVDLNYFPHSGEDLVAWCDKWIAWIKAAPAPGGAAGVQPLHADRAVPHD